MPRYRIEFSSDPETAKTINSLLIDQVVNFAMSTVEEQPRPLGEGGKGKKHRRPSRGNPGWLRIFTLIKSLDGTAKRTRIKQMMAREGYDDSAVGAMISRLKMSEVVDVYDDGSIKLRNKSMTDETVIEKVRAYEATMPSRKK